MGWTSTSQWLWRALAGKGPRKRRSPPKRLLFEPLERRELLAVITPFAARFSTNDTGDIVFVSNAILRANPADPGAADGQNGVGTRLNNNNFTMVNVDVDSDATTFNSSRADLNLPAGATVLFAGLYWGAESASALRNQLRLETPAGGGYVPVTGSVVGSTGTNDYQGFADVTALVQAGGNGTYTVANVRANVNATDKHGGWSLVVAYRDPAAPPRNMTVFDGFAVIQNTTGDRNVSINVSGFRAPPVGPVNAKLGFISYEGDRGSEGDSVTFRSGANSRVLTDSVNPPNNFFNSSISNPNSPITTKEPNFVNQLGFDSNIVQANGVIPNGATTAQVALTTGGETYFPGVVTTVIDLFAPQVDTVKSVVDLNGGLVEQGDILEYTLNVTNQAGDPAAGVVLSDPIPAFTTYVGGSLEVLSGANTGVKTDALGDDQAEFDAGGNQVRFRLGAGANAATGGTLAIGATTSLRFRVQVDATAPDDTSIDNQATVNFVGVTTGFALTGASNLVSLIVTAEADLAIVKTTNNPNPNVGETVTFNITLTNNGPQTANNVQVTDLIPPTLTFVSATPSQGTYDPATGLWNVGTVTTAVPQTLQIQATVTTPDAYVNRAVITGSDRTDPNPDNNFDAVTTPPQTADLVVTKAVSDAMPNIGDVVTFTVTLSNDGPNAATTVSITDLLPAGVTFVAATPAQGSYDAATGVWTVGTLAAGGTITLLIQAEVVSGDVQTNTASVRTVDQFDPDPTDNSSSVIVTSQLPADLELTKRVNNARPFFGTLVTFTVTLENNGPANATNVTVRDVVPTGLIFVRATPSVGTYSAATGIWTVGTLASGATATLQVVARANFLGAIGNLARVQSDQFDSDPSDNTATATITVRPTAAMLSKRPLLASSNANAANSAARAAANSATARSKIPVAVADTIYVFAQPKKAKPRVRNRVAPR